MSRSRPWFAAALLIGAAALAQTTPAPVAGGSEVQQSPAPATPSAAPSGDAPIAPDVPRPAPPPKENTMRTKWGTEFYGFVELDAILDNTQSLNDLQGNGSIARPGPNGYAAAHHRVQFSPRNSRLGFRLSAPEYNGIRASALLEMDFFGNQPPIYTNITEAAFFQNPTFRIRHFMLKAETDYVDVMIGQFWELFGWQSYYHPNSVNLQGLPGQVYSRSPQIRLSHTFKSEAVNFEIAAAAVRPPQRDSGLPDGQAGLRFFLNGWKGFHTAGGTGTALDALSLGVSGIVRKFQLPVYSATPGVADVSTSGSGVSIDGLIPIIPASATDHKNALTLNANYVRGSGINDMYTGLTGGLSGVGNVAVPGGGTYPYTSIDSGLVAFDKNGNLQAIEWTTWLVGLQYYLPTDFNLWLNVVYSRAQSYNASLYGGATTVWKNQEYVEGDIFVDLTKAFRLAVGYMYTRQEYADGVVAENQRVQLSGWFIF